MISVDIVEPGISTQTAPMVCMHCVNPTCASVCPADAIKVDEDGIVHSALQPRCIACRNCEYACPFGVPKVKTGILQMQKCDMCYDRTSEGKKPMCATVCPSGALFYGSREDIRELRPQSHPVRQWRFGEQVIHTRVWVMVPPEQHEMHVELPELGAGHEGARSEGPLVPMSRLSRRAPEGVEFL
jgi:Fe-S-cluster-containing dehydrogenase component